jgi:RNA polymerase II subunit A small phosphatase-like protein
MTTQSRVVVLDLHGTLVAEDDDDNVIRPFVKEFLEHLFARYRVAVWTAGSVHDLNHVLTLCFTSKQTQQLAGTWSGDRCTVKDEIVPNAGFQTQRVVIKRLNKFAKHLGVSMDNIVIVDDTPCTFRENFGNAIRIESFTSDMVESDSELQRVIEVVDRLMRQPSVRSRRFQQEMDAASRIVL